MNHLKPHLESYNMKFSLLNEVVDGMIMQNVINSLLVAGPPGVGKTFNIDKALTEASERNDNPILYTRYSGKITTLAFYQTLFAHASPDCILFFDDADSVITNHDSLNLLKSATEKRKHRIISYTTSKDIGCETTFEFCGKIIIGTNVEYSRSPHFAAIMDRFHVFDMKISYEEKLAKIYDIASLETDNREICDDVVKFLEVKKSEINHDKVTLRTFQKLKELAIVLPQKWKQFAEISGTYFEVMPS